MANFEKIINRILANETAFKIVHNLYWQYLKYTVRKSLWDIKKKEIKDPRKISGILYVAFNIRTF
jgi:hypothetical protein